MYDPLIMAYASILTFLHTDRGKDTADSRQVPAGVPCITRDTQQGVSLRYVAFSDVFAFRTNL